LEICRRIAEGLEAAHESGVIHRDLKPANVRITPEGKVKILDFGLAKPANEGGRGSSTDSVLSTEAGRLLGTPTYMAPEQARGKAIDKRVDIWAFGCVLFEMLTGRRAFEGEDTTDTLAFVITREPDWSLLPSATPVAVRKILTRCLQKDRSRRLRDIGDVRLELDEPAGDADSNGSMPAVQTQSPTTFRRRVFMTIGVAVVSLALGVAGTAFWRRPAPQTHAALQRFAMTLSEHVTYSDA